MIATALACMSATGSPPSFARSALRLSVTLDGYKGMVTAVALSPDGRWIAATMPGVTKVWEIRTGKSVQMLSGPENGLVRGLAFAPTGDRVASVVGTHTVMVWHPGSGERLLSFETEGKSLVSIAFSRDGERIVTAAASGLIEIWHAQTGERLRAMCNPNFHLGRVFALTITDDGRIISVGNVMSTWDEATGKLLTTHVPKGFTVAASSAGNLIAVLTPPTPGPFFLVNVQSASDDSVYGRLAILGVPVLAFSSDGARLCSGGDRLVLWNLSGPSLVPLYEVRSSSKRYHFFSACAFSSDRHHLVAADDEQGQITVWESN
jgi:WD40 repeat protein